MVNKKRHELSETPDATALRIAFLENQVKKVTDHWKSEYNRAAKSSLYWQEHYEELCNILLRKNMLKPDDPSKLLDHAVRVRLFRVIKELNEKVRKLQKALHELIPLAQHAEYPEADSPAVDRARELLK